MTITEAAFFHLATSQFCLTPSTPCIRGLVPLVPFHSTLTWILVTHLIPFQLNGETSNVILPSQLTLFLVLGFLLTKSVLTSEAFQRHPGNLHLSSIHKKYFSWYQCSFSAYEQALLSLSSPEKKKKRKLLKRAISVQPLIWPLIKTCSKVWSINPEVLNFCPIKAQASSGAFSIRET